MASLGVIREQEAGRKRVRAVGIAAAIGVTLAVGPLAWWLNDRLESGERLSDMTCQLTMWVIVLCPALLAAAVVAGWLRNRS